MAMFTVVVTPEKDNKYIFTANIFNTSLGNQFLSKNVAEINCLLALDL
jgi:hypothetical protein